MTNLNNKELFYSPSLSFIITLTGDQGENALFFLTFKDVHSPVRKPGAFWL